MSDEDILKTVADELRRFGDFDNIDYLIPQLGQAIENILSENKELEEKYYYEKNRARNELDTIYINARYYERDKWKLAIRDIIEENKSYLEYANTAYE